MIQELRDGLASALMYAVTSPDDYLGQRTNALSLEYIYKRTVSTEYTKRLIRDCVECRGIHAVVKLTIAVIDTGSLRTPFYS